MIQFVTSIKLLDLWETDWKEESAAEGEICWLLVLSMGQTPKTLDPTFPIMQLDCILSLDPRCLVNSHFFKTPHLQFVTQAFCYTYLFIYICTPKLITPMTSLWHHQGYSLRLDEAPPESFCSPWAINWWSAGHKLVLSSRQRAAAQLINSKIIIDHSVNCLT